MLQIPSPVPRWLVLQGLQTPDPASVYLSSSSCNPESPLPLLIYFKYGLLALWLPFPQLNLPNTVTSLHSGISSNRLCFTLRIHSLMCLSPPPCWGQLPDRLLKQHAFLKCSSQVLHLFWAASVLQLQQHFPCSVFSHFQAAITSISSPQTSRVSGV